MFVTRAEVAARAGTSVAVVSYVINNGPRPVAPATRERVQKAIDELGYVPNRNARSLAGTSPSTIGLLVPDILNPFFASLARSLEEHALQHDWLIVLGDSAGDKARERTLLSAFLEQRVGALVVAGVDESPHLDAATRYGIPVVLLDRVRDDFGFSTVAIDNRAAARSATQSLIDAGCARIGFVGGPPELVVSSQRLAGHRDALTAAGLPELPEFSRFGLFSKADGYAIGRELAAAEALPDGIFASSDQQAIGMISAFSEHGIRVPDDIALIGFDGTPDCRFTVPPLTSIEQPVEDIARTVMHVITGPSPLHHRRVVVQHRMVEGGTVRHSSSRSVMSAAASNTQHIRTTKGY